MIVNLLTTRTIRIARLFLRAILIGLITATLLLLTRSEVDSSSVAVYDIDIAKGSFDLDLPNDSVAYLEDAVIFYHDNRPYTVKYRIATEKLSYRIQTNVDKNLTRIIDRSAEDVLELAGALKTFAERHNLSGPGFIGSFVQSGIAYRRDEFFDHTYPRAYRDYHKYGVESLFDRYGDCEDKVILAAALLKAAGYEVGYIEVPGHILVAIKGSFGKKTVSYRDEKFAIWELTRPGHHPGEISWAELDQPTITRIGRFRPLPE